MGEETGRSRGTVVRFDDNRGFGFIKPDDGGEDLFVHQSSIVSDGFRSLRQGQPVLFSLALQGDHTRAVDVVSLLPRPPASRPCFKCGDDGHLARDCRVSGAVRGCFTCGQDGHVARDCRAGGAGGGCYSCRRTGHLARDCGGGGGRFGGGGGECYGCGGIGHMARDCPSGGRFGGGGGGRNCYECGEVGHFARECPKAA